MISMDENEIKNIKAEKGVVFCTLVEEEVREKLKKFCNKEKILYLPVMENIVSVLEKYTGSEAINKPGGQHVLNDDYFKRIEAINYTLEHDDGQGQLDLEKADVIIVGVSRTSKTPTCIYLANQGIKAANYPLVPHVGISKELDNINKNDTNIQTGGGNTFYVSPFTLLKREGFLIFNHFINPGTGDKVTNSFIFG